MDYAMQDQAADAMAAWAEHSDAPALAVVSDGAIYRVVEADADGVFIIRRVEHVIDVMWTRRSKGIVKWTAMNAYSVGCCYHTTYVNEQALRVPHGTADLGPFLDQVVIDALEEGDSWRSFSEDGETFVGAISEGDGVCPWIDEITFPEAWSEQGERPIVVVETVDDKVGKVIVARGQAHVLVVNETKEEIERWSPAELEGRLDSSKHLAIEASAAIDLLHDILEDISNLDRACEAASYTDTGDVWTLLNGIRKRIVMTVGERLPF